MAQQLVYTSAGKLLDAGRSGFGTVARSKSLSPLLVSAIERVSQFANIRGTERSRVIFVHRRIIAANNRVNLISRIADAGADYTGRTNHIAHHLIVSQEEMNRAAARGITPADVLMQFPWLSRWQGAPKFFGPEDDVPLEQAVQPRGRLSGRAAWTRLTGNPSHARLLAWDGAPRNGVLLVPRGAEPLGLLAEALAEFGPQSWSRTFTTNLETTDEMADFDWVVSSPENFREIEARCGARARLDLSQPQSLSVPPEPVQATPQPEAAPQAANRAAGITEAPDQSHDAGKRQPSHFQGVKVTVSDGSSPRYSISKPASSHSRKVRTQLILAAAAMIVLLGVLGVAAWKTINPQEDNKEKVAENQREADKKKAEDILKKAKLPQDEIDRFIQTVSEDPKGWAKFTASMIEVVKDNDFLTKIGQLDIPKSNRPTSPNWVGSLADVRKSALDLPKLSGGQNPGERLKLIGSVSKHIREAARSLKMDDLSNDGVDLVNKLVKEALSNQPAFEIADDVLGNLFAEKNDQEVFKKVIEYQAKPESVKSLTSDIIKGIKEAAFIPAGIKESLETSFANNQKAQSPANTTADTKHAPEQKPTGPSLSGVQEREILVVTMDQIKEGIEVLLLRKIIDAHQGKEITSDGIKIVVDDKPPVTKVNLIERYEPVGNKTLSYYESESKSIKIQKDGKIFLEDAKVLTIEISLNAHDREYKTWIVTDVKEEPKGKLAHTISDDLYFTVADINTENCIGTINGTLVDYLKILRVKGSPDKELRLTCGFANVEFVRENDSIKIKVKREESFNSFAKEDFVRVQEAQKNYEAALGKKHSGKKNEKEQIEQQRNETFGIWIDALKVAIGGMEVLKDKSLRKHNEINNGNINTAHQVAKEFGYRYELITYPEKGEKQDQKEFEKSKSEIDQQNIRDIKNFIGEKKIDDFLSKRFKNGEKIDNIKELNSDTFASQANIILEIAKPPAPEKSFDEIVTQLRMIAVETPLGRVLFQAKRKD